MATLVRGERCPPDNLESWRNAHPVVARFSSLGEERVEVGFNGVSSSVGDEVAFAHEQSSLPIDIATGKGIFTPSPA